MHQLRLHGVAIVPAHEVQRTVSGEQIEFDGEGQAEPACLPRSRLCGDDDLTDQRAGRAGRLEGQREHVRAAANPAPVGVERAHLDVVDHPHLDDPRGSAHRRQRALDGAAKTGDGNGDAALALLDRRGHQEGSERAPSSRVAPARVSS
jgi:hypothetical protein